MINRTPHAYRDGPKSNALRATLIFRQDENKFVCGCRRTSGGDCQNSVCLGPSFGWVSRADDRRDARPVSSLWASAVYSWPGSARLVWLFIGELERLTQPAEMSPKLVNGQSLLVSYLFAT